jgi:hypothetical protein
MIRDTYNELVELLEYSPIHIPQPTLLQWFCIGIIGLYFGLLLYIMIFHGHTFDFGMGSDVYFSPGYHANGDASIFGPDGFHFRNE